MPELKGKARVIGWCVVIFLAVSFVIVVCLPTLQDPPRERYVSAVKDRLKGVAAQAENFKQEHGVYPRTITDLTAGKDPRLPLDYCKEGSPGYRFDCRFSADGYTIVATPIEDIRKDRINKVYTISTGFVLSPEK